MWTDPTLAEWAARTDGQLIGEDKVIAGLSTDSRSTQAGDIYLAIRGESFDGHQYIQQAIAAGAIAIVAEQPQTIDDSISQLIVPDSKRALGYLAGLLRDRFQGQVIALTGSVGKTSTRAMLENILSRQANLLATQGNFNNDIGVPKTWFRLTDQHEQALIEMGANHQQEIAWLCEFSKPNIGLLLNAGQAHTEGFGGLAGVRQAKGEIIDGTLDSGCCVLNRDDPAFEQWQRRAGAKKVITFGRDAQADVQLLSYQLAPLGSEFCLATPSGEVTIAWSMIGEHMALNAAAATATALAAGVTLNDICSGLQSMAAEPGRLEPVVSNFDGPLINDAYNANPESFKAAIDVLSAMSGQPILVAGDMAELGDDIIAMHQQVGQYAKEKAITVLSVGRYAQYISDSADGSCFDSIEQLIAALPEQLNSQTAVLIKGSRSAGMERVVDALRRSN